jgi:hypothetical protein
MYSHGIIKEFPKGEAFPEPHRGERAGKGDPEN